MSLPSPRHFPPSRHNDGGCGIAYSNTRTKTVGVVQGECGRAFFSFGHELAHMFGAHHNREENNSLDYIPHKILCM